MKPRFIHSLALLALLALPACGAGNEDKPAAKPAEAGHEAGEAAVYLDPAKAGAEFGFRASIWGTSRRRTAKKTKLACQVIALGDGKFQAVFLPGGLPGEGSDGKSRLAVDGASQGNDGVEALFPQGKAGYHAIQKGDHLDGQNDKGEMFALKKVTRQSPAEGAKPPAGSGGAV